MIFTPTLETERLTLYDMSWEGYETLLSLLGDRPIRMTYSQGVVELMILSYQHERYKKLLARFVETLTEELEIPIAGGGSTTFKRQDLERGLEPDECFYIAHELAIRGKQLLDLTQDPPPDLAIEIDIAGNFLNRMAIYAALGVPEVWRFDGATLEFFYLQAGDYEQKSASVAFPLVQPADLMSFIAMAETTDDTTVIRAFRKWVRQRIEA
ncbi:MAG: Uma2 family endonuclease [Leptolyngbyaceae cyanobacterium]